MERVAKATLLASKSCVWIDVELSREFDVLNGVWQGDGFYRPCSSVSHSRPWPWTLNQTYGHQVRVCVRVDGEWRSCYNHELGNAYGSPSIVTIVANRQTKTGNRRPVTWRRVAHNTMSRPGLERNSISINITSLTKWALLWSSRYLKKSIFEE